MTRIVYSTRVKPACCVSKISSDGGCQSKETGVGMEVRLLSVGARGFFLAASRLSFAASPFNSVAPNEKKTSGTQGRLYWALLTKYKAEICINSWNKHWTFARLPCGESAIVREIRLFSESDSDQESYSDNVNCCYSIMHCYVSLGTL